MLKNETYAKHFREFVKDMGSTYRARLVASLMTLKFNIKATTLDEILSAPHNLSPIGSNESARRINALTTKHSANFLLESPRVNSRKTSGHRMDLIKLKEISMLNL